MKFLSSSFIPFLLSPHLMSGQEMFSIGPLLYDRTISESIRLAIDFNQFITIKGHAIRATRWP